MAKKLITTSKAPIAAETGITGPGTAQAAALPPEAAADPSGMNGPDGTVLEGDVLPIHTPESESGSAASAEFPVLEGPQGNDPALGLVTEPNPEVPAVASGTDAVTDMMTVTNDGVFASEAVIGDLIGAKTEGAIVEIPQGTDGAVAVLVDPAPAASAISDTALDIRGLKHALDITGCIDIDDLIDKADIGLSLVRAVDAHSALGILKGWVPGDDPVAIVGHLVALATTLENQIDALRAARVADAPQTVRIEKRRFIVTGRVRKDNVLKDIGSTVDLTEDEHAEMVGTLAIASGWNEGFSV